MTHDLRVIHVHVYVASLPHQNVALYTKSQRRLHLFAHSTQPQTILSITGSDRTIDKMAVEVKTSMSEWLGSDKLWLFYVEKDSYSITLRECPSLAVNARIVHVSPVNKPMVRHRILMANSNLEATFRSPMLLLINNACDFKVFTQFSSTLKTFSQYIFVMNRYLHYRGEIQWILRGRGAT